MARASKDVLDIINKRKKFDSDSKEDKSQAPVKKNSTIANTSENKVSSQKTEIRGKRASQEVLDIINKRNKFASRPSVSKPSISSPVAHPATGGNSPIKTPTVTAPVIHDAAYWEKRFNEEMERLKVEHANDPGFPFAAHAIGIVEEEKKLEEYINKYSQKEYKDNFFGQTAASYRQAKIADKKADRYGEYYTTGNKRDLQLAQAVGELQKTFAENNAETLKDDATLPWISQTMAGYAPQFMRQTGARIAGGIEGGFIGATVGAPQVGAVVGQSLAASAEMYNSTRNQIFGELLEMGVDEEIARQAANDEAVVSSAIEGADALGDAFTFGTTSLLKTLGKGALKGTAKGAGKELAKTLLKYGINIAQEYGEEWTQEGVGIANERRTQAGETGMLGLAKDSGKVAWGALTGTEDEETRSRMSQAGEEGAKIALMMGALPNAANVAINAKNLHTERTVGKLYSPEVDALIQEGLDSDENSEAHTLAEEMKAKQDAGKKITNAELVEMVRANEQAIAEEETPSSLEEAAKMRVNDIETNKTAENTDDIPKADNLPTRTEKTETEVKEPVAKGVAEVETKTDTSTPDTVTAPSVAELQKAQEAKAEEAAFEAGRQNVPRESVTLATPAQEEAYNAGRIEHIKNMPKEENLDSKKEQAYNVSGKLTDKTKRVFAKGRDIGVSFSDERGYISDGYIAMPIDKADADFAKSEWGARESDKLSSIVENIINRDDFIPLTSNPVEGLLTTGLSRSGSSSAYMFTLEDGRQFAVQKKYAKYLDGNNLSVVFDKGKPFALKATDNDGNFVGMALAIRHNGDTYDITDTKEVSMKSFKNKPASKTETRSTDDIALSFEEKDKKKREVMSRYGLSEDEANAVVKYKEPEAYKINAKLREDESLLDETQKKTVEFLDSALEKLPKHKGRAFRTVSFDDVFDSEEMYNDFLEKHKEGKLVIYDAYTSASSKIDGHPMDENTKYGITLEIDGESARDVDGFGNNFEKEVIFPRRRSFVVTEVGTDNDGRPYIKVKEVGNHDRQQRYSEERGDVLQRVRTEEELHSNVQEVSERNSLQSGDTKNSVQGVRADKVNSPQDKIENDVVKESAADVHDGVLDRESDNDTGVLQSESVQEAEEKRNTGTEGRKSRKDVVDENGTDVQTVEGEATAERPVDSGSDDNGVRERDNGDGDSGAGTHGNDNVDVKSKDYVITKAVAEEIDTSAPSMEDNIKAIETLHELEGKGKAPTKSQQSILAKFKGWGGLSGAFYGQAKNRLRELMSDSELAAAQSTVNDAYFTPTHIIDSVYKALGHLGFEGGNVLEPSMGVGNFFGRMPKAIKDNSSLYGVEIDTISGRIAQYLYPSANIEVSPFQDVAYKDGAFDLIIGNVPFGEVKYKYKGNKYLIHDYFFVKAMDKLKDGGVMAFLTSRGTLDKMDSKTRAELAKQGKLIAAYRLPSNVFTRSAGASPVTDLIIMQKSSDTNGERFVNLGSVTIRGEEFSINEYFANNPQNIIGELTKKWNYRSGKYDVDVTATGDVAEQLTKAIKKLPKNLINGTQTVGSVDVTENTAPVQTFAAKDNGTVEYIDAQTGEVKQIKGKSANVAKAYIKIKEVYQELVDATLNEAGQSVVEGKRKELNAEYDGFVKKYGSLEKNKKLLTADNDFFKISGLEVYDTKTKSIIKSEMFTKDTLGKRKPKRADSTLDALSISIGESGGVDLARISELTNLPESEVIKQLDDRIVYTPDGTYELNEVYLSGNVREKYEAVKGKKGFEKNEQMLKNVIPEDIPAKNITPQFGAPWIQPKYVAQFLRETLNLYSTPTVSYDSTTGTWAISGDTWGDHTLMTSKFGTKYQDAIKLAEKALNMRRIVVKDNEGRVIVTETRAAQQKAEDIKTAFEEWCFKDSERRQELVKTFNEKFNSHRNMDFSELSKYLTFDGLTETFKLRDYQKRAVARAIFNGNTLLAHGVGTGKTAEMISIAMELKRMGIAKKNMMVVPPHKVADFRNDILKMYPSAKVIMLEKGANATQRQRFYAQVAANDFDIVVIPHSSFGMLDVSADTKMAFVSNQIAELEEVLTAAQAEKGKIDGRFIKQLENQKKRLEEKLKFVTESAKDNGNTFEELGVDSLFVDEAHNFKNLPFSSKLSRVAGVSVNQSNNKTRASRAENMFMITDYLNRNNGRITFGTATPITNSMSEIYNMTRFLRPDILEDAGIQSFDAWASMFGSIVNQAEVDPSGRHMRMKERFSKFKNVAQMVEQFRRMADILKTGDVIQELPIAERIDVVNEPNDIQEEFLDIIDKMIDEIRTSGQNAKHNMLEVTTAGQMAAIDLRFVESYFEGKYTRADLNLPNNRIAQVAKKVIKEYKDSNATKGTQFVFCDVGVSDDPSKKYNLHVYGDLINRLVAAGIPRNEIAVAQDFEDKADLSAKVNTGEIRVLIGSTAVMGEGMNAQNKAVALHHMTVPARPSDIEQREGRIIRYGNENKNVRIYRYIQEKSYDSYQWQMQERKASFINQALSGGTVEELEEMSDFQLTAREAKAVASGNPLLLEKIEVEDKLNKLKSLRNKFNTDKLEMQDRLAMLPNRIGKLEKQIADTKADLETINASGAEFELTVGKTKHTERAKAAEALEKAVSKAPRNGTRTLIGQYKGLELYYTASIGKGIEYTLKGNKEYTIEGGESARGNITRIINAVEKISSDLSLSEAMLKNYKSEIETLKKEVFAEFPKAKEFEELQTKLNEIDTQLGINVSEVDMSEVVVGEEDADGDVEQMYGAKEADHSDQWTAERVGDKNKKPKSLSQIIEDIRHDFGVNITTGHIRGSDIRGTHTKGTGGIRTKKALDLPTISHELGHDFDEKYGLRDGISEDMQEELVSQLDDGLKEKYPAQQLVGEGIAEYVRKFLQNRETAAIDYPLFTDHFLGSMTGKELAQLEQLADDVNAYYALDADTATSSIKLYGEKAPDARTVDEKLKAKADEIYQAWVDANHGIKRFDLATGADTYKIATNAAYSDAIAGNMISGGDLTDANGKYVSPGLMTALHGLDLNNKEEYRLFGEYLTVKHGPERLAEGMRTFSDDRKNNTAWMNNRQAEIERQHPEFVEISERLYKFWDKFMQTWAVNTGLVDKATYQSWRDRWEYYVPFNRVVNQDGITQGAKRGFANQNSTIKKARGSGRDIVHPVDNMIVNLVKMVNAGVRNNVMVQITTQAQKLKADASFLEKVPMPLTATKMDMTGVKEKLTEMFELSEMTEKAKTEATGYVDALDDILMQYGRGKAHGDVIFVLKNGQPEAWKINDAGLLESLTSMSPKTMDGILDAYAVVSRFMTANITGLNTVWSIFSNLPKDLQSFYVYSPDKNIVKLARGLCSAYLNKFKGANADPLYKEYLALGGGQTSVYTADRNLAKQARKQMKRKSATNRFQKINWNPLDWIGFISDTIESGPRYAIFKILRDKGISPQDAFYEAMDITVNFRKGGRVSREMNKVIPFFNANVQGLDKFRRWITAEELAKKDNRLKRVRARTAFLFATGAIAAGLVFALNNGDDEKEKEYEQLSNFIKNSYWNIPLGDGKYFAIPKPRELGVLSSFFETCMEYGIGDNDHAFDEFYAYASENFLPAIANDIAQVGSKGVVETGMNIIGSLGIIGVVGYLGANRDFLGRPIVSSGLQNLEPKDQYTARTSKIAYWVGQATNGSPQQIDFFFQQILGGWWKSQKALFPVGGENVDYTLGVRNTYVKDNQYSTDLTNWLYDRADKTARAKNSNPTDIDKAISAKWDSNMTSFYGKYYKQAKNKSETTATRATRQTVLDMIHEYQKGIDSNYKTKTQKAVEKVCKEQNSTEYLPSVMSVTVKDANDKEHTLSDIQYVEYQTDYLRLYWETIEDSLPEAQSASERARIVEAAKRVAREKAQANTLKRIGAGTSKFAKTYEGVSNKHLTEFFAGLDEANTDNSVKKSEVVDVIREIDIEDTEAWALFLSQNDSYGANYAKGKGVAGNKYVEFLDTLDKVDKPTESGNLGSYTQDEATEAIRRVPGISNRDRAILWKSVNKNWKDKNNPWRAYLR